MTDLRTWKGKRIGFLEIDTPFPQHDNLNFIKMQHHRYADGSEVELTVFKDGGEEAPTITLDTEFLKWLVAQL